MVSVPKKITVEGVGVESVGVKSVRVKLSNNNEFEKWLNNNSVECVLDGDGCQIVGFESLDDEGKYKLGPQKQARLANNEPHINRSCAVFVLYADTTEGPDPIGTAFAVSDSLILTAAHNIVEREDVVLDVVDMKKFEDDSSDEKEQKGDSVVDNLMIARVLEKSLDGTVTVKSGIGAVTLVKYHYHHDWAFLKLQDGIRLKEFIPLATKLDELPPAASDTSEAVHVYQCPVTIFRDATRTATALYAISQRVDVGIVHKRTMSIQNGGFRGSCGGPYIFRNKAVAFHIESSNEAVNFEMLEESINSGRKRRMSKIEKVAEVAESCTSSHASLGSGLILQSRSGLMKVYRGEIKV